MIMKYLDSLDGILEQLRDKQWHSLEEIKKSISLPADKIRELLHFLQKQAFISEKNEKLRITCLGLKFLQLQS